MGKIVSSKKKLKLSDQYPLVDDTKLRMSLISMSDQWNEYAQHMIYETYTDRQLLGIFQGWRNSRAFQSGSKDKTRREVIRFPNGYVYNFCKAVFEPTYGHDWPINPKVWQHELIRPWLLIDLK